MATLAQIAANRANALKSTGPQTEAGKISQHEIVQTEAVSSVSNRKHGFPGELFSLPPKILKSSTRSLPNTTRVEPETEIERNLIQMMAESFWLPKRAQMKLMVAETQLETDFSGAIKLMEIYARYETKSEQAFAKCRKQLEDMRKERRKQETASNGQKHFR